MEKVVVLIDDDSDDRMLLKESIQEVDASTVCIEFSHPRDALQEISSHEFPFSPDYIFIDLNMPMMNGEECLIELKGIEKLNDAKFILNSTDMPQHISERLKKKGADVTFQKPFQISLYTQIMNDIFDTGNHKGMYSNLFSTAVQLDSVFRSAS